MSYLDEIGMGGFITYEEHMCRLDAAVKATLATGQIAVLKSRHLDRACEIFEKAYFNDGPDRMLNQTRFHDLLGMEGGACDWPDETFLGDVVPD